MLEVMPPMRDLAVAGALVLLALVSLHGIDEMSGADRPVDAWAAGLVVLASATTAFRSVRPLVTLLVVAAATSAYLILGYPYGVVLLALSLAVWTVAHRRPAPVSAAAAAAALAALLLHLPTHPSAFGGLLGVAPATAWVAVPYSAGLARRLVREARGRERAAADQRLMASERLRVATEVHDVVGHALAAIQMQADVALHVDRARPGSPRQEAALSTISRASREALEELRWTLRTTHPHATGHGRDPTPGLARLHALAEGVMAAGTQVDVAFHGPRRPVPAAVDLAAYRVIQEALTNVVKHSAHPRARVTVTYEPHAIRIHVANDALAIGPSGPGLGTTGMRHRVEQLGGHLCAGHDPAHQRYVVDAYLPTDRSEDPS